MTSDSRTASFAPLSTASSRPDITKRSSAPIGVMNAVLSDARSWALISSARCSASRIRSLALASPFAHSTRAAIPSFVTAA